MSKTELLVPYILNGRVWDWLFVSKEPTYFVLVAVRAERDEYKICNVEFTRNSRSFLSDEGEWCTELYYSCTNPHIYFDREGDPRFKKEVL